MEALKTINFIIFQVEFYSKCQLMKYDIIFMAIRKNIQQPAHLVITKRTIFNNSRHNQAVLVIAKQISVPETK